MAAEIWYEKRQMVTGYGHVEYLTRNEYVFKDKLKAEAGKRWDEAKSG